MVMYNLSVAETHSDKDPQIEKVTDLSGQKLHQDMVSSDSVLPCRKLAI
jgi:hypothetical protein